MYQPEAYVIALLFMIASMICWGSWANTQKLASGYSFQLFYWDYVIGILAGSLFWGFTLGSLHGGTGAFLSNIFQADLRHWGLAILGGIVFNVANLLLVAAIAMAGMAVAFPVGIGLALVLGVILNYLVQPKGNAALLFGGVALIVVALLLDAVAYRRREARSETSARGIQLSVVSGILMALFYPFVAKASLGEHSFGPYGVTLAFAVGVALCALPLNGWLMKHPLTGDTPVEMSGYPKAKLQWHFWGLLGGLIWCTGAVTNFVASHANVVGPAVSYAIGQGATMISAAWGVLVWREFANAPKASRRLIPLMFVFFIVGLGLVAIAPIFPR